MPESFPGLSVDIFVKIQFYQDFLSGFSKNSFPSAYQGSTPMSDQLIVSLERSLLCRPIVPSPTFIAKGIVVPSAEGNLEKEKA